MSTQTIEKTTLEQIHTEEVEEKTPHVRHIVNPPGNTHIWKLGMSAQDVVDIARVKGLEVVALCGEKFVPRTDPRLVKETCDTCLEIAGNLMGGG